MKRAWKMLALAVVVMLPAVLKAEGAKGATCQWNNQATLQTHVNQHITYPATGKQIKEACKKEMPSEFTQAERTCISQHLSDAKTYTSADEVLMALGAKK